MRARRLFRLVFLLIRLVVLLLVFAAVAVAIAVWGGALVWGPGPTPTPTAPPTPTPLPVQVSGWEETVVHVLCLEVEQSYPEIEGKSPEPIAEAARRILTGLGLQVVAEGTPCDAILTLTLTGEALGAEYTLVLGSDHTDYCYSGAEVDGQVALTVPGRVPLTLPISGRFPPPSTISNLDCSEEPLDAPFEEAWPEALLNGLAHLWGPQVLIQALEDESVWVRGNAVRALGGIGPEDRVIPALIQALEDENWSVRRTVVRALGEIGPEEGVVPALVEALGDERDDVRKAAAETLGEIGPAAVEAVPALIQALEDESVAVPIHAAKALTAITGQDFGKDPARWQQWWEEQQ